MRVLTTVSPRRHGRPRPARSSLRVRKAYGRRSFTPLIDAKAASGLLGVPYTWLLAQARAGRVPHHRLGHYVRFDPDDLRQWLNDTRIGPAGLNHTAER
jgi:excisionase family DNA binding protein